MPLASLSAALIAALVGFGGTVALIVQAGQALGGTPDQITSAVTALCLGIALPGALLSFRLRMPVGRTFSCQSRLTDTCRKRDRRRESKNIIF